MRRVQFPQFCDLTVEVIETPFEVMLSVLRLLQSLPQLVLHHLRSSVDVFELIYTTLEKSVDDLEFIDSCLESIVGL